MHAAIVLHSQGKHDEERTVNRLFFSHLSKSTLDQKQRSVGYLLVVDRLDFFESFENQLDIGFDMCDLLR